MRSRPGPLGLVLGALAAASVLSGCATPNMASPRPTTPPSSMQWLYASGEAAVLQKTVYSNLVTFVGSSLATRQPHDVVAGYRPPYFDRNPNAGCGKRPPAVVFDIDETVILNLGYERYLVTTGSPYSTATWSQWEKSGAHMVQAVPGATEAMAKLADLGITLVFISDRSSENADQTIEALRYSGIAAPVHRQTLFLKGDVSGEPGKDARRAYVSASFCVLALVGDQLGDFSDALVRAGRLHASSSQSQPWGTGWFILPNPVYGSSVRGTIDEIIPEQYQWAPGAP